jgi:hypothetical protein
MLASAETSRAVVAQKRLSKLSFGMDDPGDLFPAACIYNSYIYTPKIVRKPRRSETPNRSGVGVALFCRGELNK